MTITCSCFSGMVVDPVGASEQMFVPRSQSFSDATEYVRLIGSRFGASQPKDCFVHALRTLWQRNAKAAAVFAMRSNHVARSNNVAI